jgi:HD-GYP domain-containing protein (c-di-GMP phosphodiesterase class II)
MHTPTAPHLLGDQLAAPTRRSEILAALSYALDITEGQPPGHAIRSCLIGMRLADEIGLPAEQRAPLFYALLLKDLGCSSNAAKVCSLFGADDIAAKRDMKTVDWANLFQAAIYGLQHTAPNGSLVEKARQSVTIALQGGPLAARPIFELRCDRGAQIAERLGFPKATTEAIRSLDEHWNGRGYPHGLRREAIPLLGRIICLAQSVEIFWSTVDHAAAYTMARRRSKRWFDPQLVAALERFRSDELFWASLGHAEIEQQLSGLITEDPLIDADDEWCDRIALAFAQVIDAKSPWTYHHSEGVATIVAHLGADLGLGPAALRDLWRAGLLHDIGKLGISNQILDKPGKLTEEEFASLRRHANYSRDILARVACFRHLADLVAAHHERLDGRGYPDGLTGDQLSLPARLLAIADRCEALISARPYRAALTPSQALDLLRRDVGSGICPISFAALERYLEQTEAAEPPMLLQPWRLDRAA